MDLSNTVVPRSDQINFEDVQSVSITAVIKSVRAGSKDQPVFIDLDGYDGRPYKPSKSMRRVLIGGWGADGHSWVGKSLTLVGDPGVKFGGVAVGGIKVKGMSHIDSNFSLMLTVSRGKRVEHFVEKINIVDPLQWFSEQAITADAEKLERFYQKTKSALAGNEEKLKKLDEVNTSRKNELSGHS
ncbi:hypothetical protein RJE46_14275 [Cedecea neteri]|uniref:hypothetical protein n=1 Tax=Cedecea neteri TaxID=158822 RepID=UPI0028929DEC|nr:hypothetical protein [Cedecea neteri]WNJ77799.1 hypothetical protein RJE46_14275 [Cedecea neteri]